MMKSAGTNGAENPEKTRRQPSGKMDAIASGVQARFEETLGYSQRITEETANIARSLGVSSTEIANWVAFRSSRLTCDKKQMQEIKSLLYKACRPAIGAAARSQRG